MAEQVAVSAAALVVLAFPATAWGEATLVTRELPVGGARMLASAEPSTRFNLVGLHWRGRGEVWPAGIPQLAPVEQTLQERRAVDRLVALSGYRR